MSTVTNSPSADGKRFTKQEIGLLWKEIDRRTWRPGRFYEEFERANPDFVSKSGNWRDNIRKVISKAGSPIPAQGYHRAALANTFGWAVEEFADYLRTGDLPTPSVATESPAYASNAPTPASTPDARQDSSPATTDASPVVAASPILELGNAAATDIQHFFQDRLTGVALAELVAPEDVRRTVFADTAQALRKNPNDICLRAAYVWSVLVKGVPTETAKAVLDTARWLLAKTGDAPPPPAANLERWRARIGRLQDNTLPHVGFQRRHLLETVVRAALLRWLKASGLSSHLRANMTALAGAPLVAALLPMVAVAEHLPDWVTRALLHMDALVGCDEDSGTARLCLLWLTARQGHRERMAAVSHESCRWLMQRPRETAVRCATICLAGKSRDEPAINAVIDSTREWLAANASGDACVIRTAILWLIYYMRRHDIAIPAAASFIDATKAWLKDHPNEECVRLAYMLLIAPSKAQAPQEISRLMADTKKIAEPDHYQLNQIAILLAEATITAWRS